MPIFDITNTVSELKRNRRNIFDRPKRGEVVAPIVKWLEEHVGEYHGPGEENVVYVGTGWEISLLFNGRTSELERTDSVVTWHVDITDEQLAMLFALRWMK